MKKINVMKKNNSEGNSRDEEKLSIGKGKGMKID